MTAVQSIFCSRLHGPYGRAGDRHFMPGTAFGPGIQSSQRRRRVLCEVLLDRLFCYATPHRFSGNGIIHLFLSGQASYSFSQAFRTMRHWLAC